MDGASKQAPPRNPAASEMHVCADAEAVAITGAELFITSARAAIAERGRFRVALSGGSTPRRTYELLASAPFRSRVDWARVDFFWADERYVPPDHPDSNYGMTREALLRHVPASDENIYRVPTEISPPPAAAQAYEKAVRKCFGESRGIPRFDLN